MRLLLTLALFLVSQGDPLKAATPQVTFSDTPAAITDKEISRPFFALEVSDADAGDLVTMEIRVSPADSGGFPLSADLSRPSPGLYVLTQRAPGLAQDFLTDLDFTPAENRVAPGQSADTSFEVIATDTATNSDTNSVDLSVRSVNDPPTIDPIAPQPQTTMEDTAKEIMLTVNDVDPGQTANLELTGESTGSRVVRDSDLVFGGAGSNRTLTITPLNNRSGTTTITITVSDGELTTTTQFALEVQEENDAPTIDPIPDQETPEESAIEVAFTIDDPDPRQSLTLDYVEEDQRNIIQDIYFVESSPVRGINHIMITPRNNRSGTATIEIIVSDGQQTAREDFVLTVRDVNDAPTLTFDFKQREITDNQDYPFSQLFSLTIDDVDHTSETDLFTLEIKHASPADAEMGRLDPAEPIRIEDQVRFEISDQVQQIWYRPTNNVVDRSAPVNLLFTISDQAGGTNTYTNTLTVVGINDLPDILGTPTALIRINDDESVKPFASVRIVDVDGKGEQEVTVRLEMNVEGMGTFSDEGPFSGTPEAVTEALQDVVFTPVEDRIEVGQSETVTFTIIADDGPANDEEERVNNRTQVAVTSVNSPPSIQPAEEVLPQPFPVSGDPFVQPFKQMAIAITDDDPTLTVTLSVDDPERGSLVGPVTPGITIQSYTDEGGLARIVSPGHGLASGDLVRITGYGGADSPVSAYNNVHEITRLDDDAFTIPVNYADDLDPKGEWVRMGVLDEDFVTVGEGPETTAELQSLVYAVNEDFLFPPEAPGYSTFTLRVVDSVLNTAIRSLAIVLQQEPRNWLVTETEDDPELPGSLRYVLNQIEANKENDAVITFALPSYPALIRLDAAHGPVELRRNTALKGPGADLLTISGDSDGSGQPDLQLFRVLASAAMEGLTLTQGSAGTGGAVYVGPTGRLLLRGCSISHSRALQWGGAIDVQQGSLWMSQCFVHENQTDPSLGLGGGAISLYTDQTNVFINTTFSGNVQQSANGFGGGAIYAENYTPSTELTIVVDHCTFAENVDTANVASSMLANGFGTVVHTSHSIFADGQSRNLEVQGAARLDSHGGNLSDDSTRTLLTQGGQPNAVILLDQPSDQTDTEPRLLPLGPGLRPTPAYPLAADSPAIGAAFASAQAVDQHGSLRDIVPDAGALESEPVGRLVINEIQTDDASTDFIEFYVLRDSTPVDLDGFTLWVNGELRLVFPDDTTVQPGFGLIVADALILLQSPESPPPILVPSVPLGLDPQGIIELRRPGTDTTPVLQVGYSPNGVPLLQAFSGTNGVSVLQAGYANRFVDPHDPDNDTKYAPNSITLAPQFRGYAYLPHSLVLAPPLGGVNLQRDPSANVASPGSDTSPTPFGSPNAFPVAVADHLLVGEDDLSVVPVLANDLDADGLDQLVVIDVSTTTDPGSGSEIVSSSAKGALVKVTPAPPFSRMNAVSYDPRSAQDLQQLPEGAEITDEFFYEMIDFGQGVISGYEGSIGSPITTVLSPAHRLVDGDVILILGSTVGWLDGEHTVTWVDEDRFSIPTPFVFEPSAEGSWVTQAARNPTQRQEGRVEITILGANDPPAPRADLLETDEETVLRILGDSDLLGTSTTFPTDSQYPANPVMGDVAILQNDVDPDTDDDATSLRLVGVVGSVHPIRAVAGEPGDQTVRVDAPAHGLADAERVLISGYAGHPSYNGYHTVTVVDPNTFTIPVAYIDSVHSGVWVQLEDDTRLSALSQQGAEVQLEIRADRRETSIVYNPGTSGYLDGLAQGEPAYDLFFCAVEDRHGAVSLAALIVRVTGVNDPPESDMDPISLTALGPFVSEGNPVDQVLEQLDVLYALPSAPGRHGRMDVVTAWVSEPPVEVVLTEVWTTSEDSALPIAAAVLLSNDHDRDRTDLLHIEAIDALSREHAVLTLSSDGSTLTYDPRTSMSLNSLAREEAVLDAFAITVADAEGATATNWVAVLVTGLNDTPRGIPDLLFTSEGIITDDFNPLVYPANQVLLHDQEDDINGSAPDNKLALIPTESLPTTVPGATVRISEDQVTYDPTGAPFLEGLGEGQTYTDRFSYTVMDGSFLFANDDLFTVAADSADLVLDVLANDRNLTGAGGALNLVTLGTPSHHGSVSYDSAERVVRYTPEINFLGDERFTYTVADEAGNIDSGLVTVRVTVAHLNGNLRAGDDMFSVARGEAPTLDVLANDHVVGEEGADLQITRVLSGPARDTVQLEDNQLTYVQQSSGPFPYTEQFTYEISGGGTARATATVSVQVVDRQGTLVVRDDTFSVPIGVSNNLLDVLLNDSLRPGSPPDLTIRSTSEPQDGVVALTASATALLYTPRGGFVGSDTFTYEVTDGMGGTGSGRVTLHVGELSTNPDFFAVAYDESPADDELRLLDVLANDRVLQTSVDTITLVGADPSLTPLGQITVDEDQTTLLFNPAADAVGEGSFTYTIQDGTGNRATGEFTLSVIQEGVHANADFFTVQTDSPVTEFLVLANDVSIPDRGRTLSIVEIGTGLSAPNHGGVVTVSDAHDRLFYTPAPGFIGEETFSYTMTDSRQSDTAKVVVTVTEGVLSANPDVFTVFYEPLPGNAAEATPFALPVLANDAVIPDQGRELTVTVVHGDPLPGPDRPDVAGEVSLSTDQRALIYTPGDADGPFPYVEQFSYEMTDGTTRRSEAHVTIEVQRRVATEAPTALPDVFSVPSDSRNNLLEVLANDNIRPASANTWTITETGPTQYDGIVVIEDTHLRYTPRPGFVGVDMFSYYVSDGVGGLTAALVRVQVGELPLNPDRFSVLSGSSFNVLEVLANDAIRPDGADTFRLLTTSDPAQNGIAGVSGNVVLYTPDPDYPGPYPYVETFSYHVVNDSQGTAAGQVVVTVYEMGSDRDSAEVGVVVAGVNDLPTIQGTSPHQGVYLGSTLQPFANVLIADVDRQGTEPLEVEVQLDDPTHGFLVSADGFVDRGNGVYGLGSSDSGVSPAEATAAVRGLIFVPTAGHRVTPDINESTRLTLVVRDGIGDEVTDDTTTVTTAHAFSAKLLSSDALPSNRLGYSVAAEGTLAVVGAPFALHGGVRSGAAFVYRRNVDEDNSWSQIQKLTPTGELVSDMFGYTVAISGDTIVVGAVADVEDQKRTGSAYVFQRDADDSDRWNLVAKLVPGDGAEDDLFGCALSLDGDTLAVGAQQADDAARNAGAVYVYGRDGDDTDNWIQIQKLLASDSAADDQFGGSVSLGGSTLLVGSRLSDAQGADSGSAYLFVRHAGDDDPWGQVAQLLPEEGAVGDQFGISVALEGDLAVVGAWLDDDRGENAGAAYLFRPSAETAGAWTQTAKLLAADGAAGDGFGKALTVGPTAIAVGAPHHDAMGHEAGAVYIFRTEPGATEPWVPVDQLFPDGNAAGDEFGSALSLELGTLAVGAWADNDAGANSGAVYLFRMKYNNPPRVTGSIPGQTVVSGKVWGYPVPLDTFSDPDLGEVLELSAALELPAGPSPLPVWLEFDPPTELFVGTPGPGTAGVYRILLTAKDTEGATTTLSFDLSVLDDGGSATPEVVPEVEVSVEPTGEVRITCQRSTFDSHLRYLLETSSDLIHWTVADSLITSETVVEHGQLADTEIVVFQVAPVRGSADGWFFRVRVQR